MTSQRVWAFAAVLLVTSGCKEPAPKGGGVAVIDLDRLARELGREQTMARDLQTGEKDLQSQLEKIRDSFNAQIQQAAETAAKAPSPQVQAQVNAMRNEAQRRLDEESEKARTIGKNRRVELANAFRTEVRPIARRVAARRGVDVVLTRTDMVLDLDPSADITDEVMGEMRRMEAQPPAAPPAATTPAPSTTPPPTAPSR